MQIKITVISYKSFAYFFVKECERFIMSDYKRLVSYIYAYPNAVRGKNTGFAKAEVRNGQFILSVNLKGVYTDVPFEFGVYILVDKDKQVAGRFNVLKVGSMSVNNGSGSFNEVFLPENISDTGYTFADISGIAIAAPEQDFYMMFSMWEDSEVNPDTLNFVEKKQNVDNNSSNVSDTQDAALESEKETKAQADSTGNNKNQILNATENNIRIAVAEENSVKNHAAAIDPEQRVCAMESNTQNTDVPPKTEADIKSQINKENGKAGKSVLKTIAKSTQKNAVESTAKESQNNYNEREACAAGTENMPDSNNDAFAAIFKTGEKVNIFDDDYYYDCIEVTPDNLKSLPLDSAGIANNSFLMHGYYNFRHLIFGKVRENDNNTKYFIGVPGMYCNRERFMASMFGFNNFKKSHRSDYTNPYFGYWYQEI